MAEIDAPESNQDFSQVSKKSLSGLVFGKDVSVEVETKDKCNGLILNLAGQDELTRLRKENGRLLMEREILKKAADFFAKELG